MSLPENLEVGDVGFVVLRNVRSVEPAALEIRTGDLLYPGHLHPFDLAELGEVDHRHRGQDRASSGLRQGLFDVRLYVLLEDPVLAPRTPDQRQVDAQLSGETPYRRTGIDLCRLVVTGHRRPSGLLFGAFRGHHRGWKFGAGVPARGHRLLPSRRGAGFRCGLVL